MTLNFSLRVISSEKALAAIAVCSRALFPFDLVFNKIGTNVYITTQTEDSSAVIETNLESVMTTHQVQRGEATVQFHSHAKESTKVNKNFIKTITNNQPTHTFSDDENSYVYRQIIVNNDIEFIVRIEVNCIAEEQSEEPNRQSLSICRTFNEVQTIFRQSNWSKDLGVKNGAILSSEISENGTKVARWVAISKFLGAAKCIIGYSVRKNPHNPNSHTSFGSSAYQTKNLASMVSLKDTNLYGVLYLIFSKLKGLDNGKYIFVREGKKNLFKLCLFPES